MSERVCVIHVGTHKTGTTSQQYFLSDNQASLAQTGTLFPNAGWYNGLPGAHQIAWDLLKTDESDHLQQLLDELRATTAHTAIVTSEDLVLLHIRPRALQVLRDAIASTGFTPKVLVYLRAQPEYAESLYVERIKAGYVRPVQSYLDEIFATHAYLSEGTQIRFEFLYTRLLAIFSDVFGRGNIHVRPYTSSKTAGHIFSEFLNGICTLSPVFAETPFNLTVKRPRENPSISFLQLLGTAFEKTHPGATVTDVQAFVDAYAPGMSAAILDGRFSLFSHAESLRFLELFSEDNRLVEQEYGAHIPFQAQSDIAPADDPRWERATLERPTYERNVTRWLRESD
ncbi:MAG TPA: hypothetical protein VFN49_10485 [Candidatus Aquilonibacter sp.]|nr:hypothetical protein [Candidatus Aquilonibacter sp.]